MISPVVLAKENPNLPDSYGLKITYITGIKENLEIASHYLNKELSMLEVWLKDDLCTWIPLSAIQRLEFDKNFSKILELKRGQDVPK